MGQVTDIEPGAWGYPESEVKLAIVGQAEALFTDETGAAKSTIRFEKSALGKAQLLKIPGQADCEFIFRGNWSEDAALVDHQGKVVWTYGHSVTHVAVDDMGAGVLGSDGKLFFAVGFNGKGSLDLLDANGQKQWSEPGDDIWHVEIADAKGDGNPEIGRAHV